MKDRLRKYKNNALQYACVKRSVCHTCVATIFHACVAAGKIVQKRCGSWREICRRYATASVSGGWLAEGLLCMMQNLRFLLLMTALRSCSLDIADADCWIRQLTGRRQRLLLTGCVWAARVMAAKQIDPDAIANCGRSCKNWRPSLTKADSNGQHWSSTFWNCKM